MKNTTNPQLQTNTVMRPTSSRDWLEYFQKNADSLLDIPWDLGADATEEELAPIIASLQAWQLGETSEGHHLLSSAKNYAEVTGDFAFISAAKLFIKEEQRHGEMLGRFLDSANVPRIRKNWGDSAFRAIRYSMPSMEIWATPVIMVETIALLYYRAIRDATKSRVLRKICEQILHDEIPHIRFQYERIAILHRNRSRSLRLLTHLAQRILFFGVCILVWIGHHKAFRAGGFSFRKFWKKAWRKMRFGWSKMNPSLYDWDGFSLNNPHQESVISSEIPLSVK